MLNPQLNRIIKSKQFKTLLLTGGIFLIVITIIVVLLLDARPKKTPAVKQEVDLTGMVDEAFSEANTESALSAQQTELEELKNAFAKLQKAVTAMHQEQRQQLALQNANFEKQLGQLVASNNRQPDITNNKPNNNMPPEITAENNTQFWHAGNLSTNVNPNTTANNAYQVSQHASTPTIHTVSFKPKPLSKPHNYQPYLNPAHYVPANTSVRAIVLGGADADASVNGQSKNNGVMLFKFLEDGTLPNGQHSHLQGCRVSANSYGDISSERAFATLYRLSCAHPGKPIIDKAVTGWIFFNGKVGIKGQPLMRDNKVMQWAGISGALSGVAQAAQYAQSIQQFGGYGIASAVPSNRIAPFAAYGGAAKAADSLSQYYVKRAEQYHPVIQVGAGNVVTVVFKDGFYLEPDELQTKNHHSTYGNHNSVAEKLVTTADTAPDDMNFSVPPEVLKQIDRANQNELTNNGTNSGLNSELIP